MGRLIFWCFAFTFFLTSCAHFRPASRIHHQRSEVSQNIFQAFTRIQVVRSYDIFVCSEIDTSVCRSVVQMSKASGFGSGGIIRHNENSTEILTAAHVVDEFNQLSPVTPEATEGFLLEFARVSGILKPELMWRLKKGHLKIVGLKTVIYVVASDGNSYKVRSLNCDAGSDACIVQTNKIDGVEPLSLSSSAPQIGDTVLIASGPFGYGIPGMMVPIFEGIYSGETPDGKDYYTLQVVPGSSGSLIVNHDGDIVGIVSMFITGSFCPGELGCQVLPSGVMVSVPLSVIHELVYPPGE